MLTLTALLAGVQLLLAPHMHAAPVQHPAYTAPVLTAANTDQLKFTN